jgi:hypothetical protein
MKIRMLGIAVAGVLVAAACSDNNTAPTQPLTAQSNASKATGVQTVKWHGYFGGTDYVCTDEINKSASGIVTETRAPGACTPDANVNGVTTVLLFKPQGKNAGGLSCATENRVGGPYTFTYTGSNDPWGLYTVDESSPNGSLVGQTEAFWTLGVTYTVCFYNPPPAV